MLGVKKKEWLAATTTCNNNKVHDKVEQTKLIS
jgi:hypothetical protein